MSAEGWELLPQELSFLHKDGCRRNFILFHYFILSFMDTILHVWDNANCINDNTIIIMETNFIWWLNDFTYNS